MRLRNALQVRFDDDGLALVTKAAKLQGIPPSTYGRKVMENAAIRDLLPKDPNDAED